MLNFGCFPPSRSINAHNTYEPQRVDMYRGNSYRWLDVPSMFKTHYMRFQKKMGEKKEKKGKKKDKGMKNQLYLSMDFNEYAHM